MEKQHNEDALTPTCNAENFFEPHRYGPVCGAPATATIMLDGPQRVCWAHGTAHDAGRALTFHSDEPAAAASNG